MRWIVPALMAVIAAAGAAPAVHAQAAPGPCGVANIDRCGVDGAGDGFTPIAERDVDGVPSGLAPVGVSANGPAFQTDDEYVAACDGNSLGGENALCVQASESCPNEGDVRFWHYRRRYVVGTEPPPFARVLTPPFVCLGPDDPRIDPTIAIPSIIDRDFKRVVVLKGVAEVSPAPDTLVNVETRFTTAAPASYDIPLTILGQSVVITATAASWTWHFGDGQTQRLTAGSSTTHTYEKSGPRAAFVVIEWTGTYRIGGDPTVRQVNGTATTTGDPVPVQVRTARSELVDEPG